MDEVKTYWVWYDLFFEEWFACEPEHASHNLQRALAQMHTHVHTTTAHTPTSAIERVAPHRTRSISKNPTPN